MPTGPLPRSDTQAAPRSLPGLPHDREVGGRFKAREPGDLGALADFPAERPVAPPVDERGAGRSARLHGGRRQVDELQVDPKLVTALDEPAANSFGDPQVAVDPVAHVAA